MSARNRSSPTDSASSLYTRQPLPRMCKQASELPPPISETSPPRRRYNRVQTSPNQVQQDVGYADFRTGSEISFQDDAQATYQSLTHELHNVGFRPDHEESDESQSDKDSKTDEVDNAISYNDNIYEENKKRDCSPEPTNAKPKRGHTSPQPSRPKQKIPPQPVPSKNWTPTLCAVVMMLCAIAAGAMWGPKYWPKIVAHFDPPPPLPVVPTIIQDLKNDFAQQPPMTFKIVGSALRRVTEPEPAAPAIILLIAELGAEELSGQFARKIADSVSRNKPLVISGHSYQDSEHDVAKREIDTLLEENLMEDRLTAVLVERLDLIPPEAAIIFHTYCDHENAPFKRAVYVFTVASKRTGFKSMQPKDWDALVQDHLYRAWKTGGDDQISSLLSRLTVSVAAIVSGE